MSDSPPATAADEAPRAQALLEAFEKRRVATRDGTPTWVLEPGDLPRAWRTLRDEGSFETVTFVTAVDRFPSEPRFEVSWQLHSVRHGDRVRLRAVTGSEDPRVPSCTPLWPGASFFERECYDLFGVRFDGHPDLRRLMMPEAYEHHPLRKDFPHQGIEPDKLYREWDAERRRDWDAEGRR